MTIGLFTNCMGLELSSWLLLQLPTEYSPARTQSKPFKAHIIACLSSALIFLVASHHLPDRKRKTHKVLQDLTASFQTSTPATHHLPQCRILVFHFTKMTFFLLLPNYMPPQSLLSCSSLCLQHSSPDFPQADPFSFRLQEGPHHPIYKNHLHFSISLLVIQSLSHIDSFATHGLQPARLLYPWDFPGKNGVGGHFLLQRISSTQGSNPCPLHWQGDSLPLSHLGSPYLPYCPLLFFRCICCIFIGMQKRNRSLTQQEVWILFMDAER